MSTEILDDVPITVQSGPGVAPGTLEYVRERLGSLGRYAPRPITAIHASVVQAQRLGIEVRASVSVGNHVVRSHEIAPNLRAALDVVNDRLRRQLAELPHGKRGDHVPHHTVRER